MAWYDFVDYIPVASNIKGAAQGNWVQAAGGPLAAGGQAAYNYLRGDASKGYNTAAQGAGMVSDQSRQFAEEQWRRQMEGLGQAQGAYGNAQNYWNSQYGSQGAGQAENYWAQNQDKFSQPGRTASAYDQFNAWAMDPRNNSTQSGATTAGQYMGGQSSQGAFYDQYGKGLTNYSGPQAGAQQWAQTQGQFNTTGAGEDFWSQNQGRYTQPTNSQGAYGQAQQQLGGPSASERMLAGGNMGTNILGGSLGDHQNWARAPVAHQMNEFENKGLVRNATQASDFYQSQLPQLSNQGIYENFVSGEISGTNPLYERTKQQGMASINQEMARRGNFNSGGALTALGNYTGALDAADYENRANRAKAAQEMQMGRIGLGMQSAQGVSGLDVQRGQTLSGMDTANESAQLGRQNFGLDAEKAASGEKLASDQLKLSAAGQSDSAQLARLMGLGSLGNQADSANLAQLTAGQNASKDAQNLQLQRMMNGIDAANIQDQTRLASDAQALQRMMASFNMAQGSDDYKMQQAKQFYEMGQGVDQSNLARFGMGFDQAQGADQFGLAQLLGGGQLAGQAQDAEQRRKAQAFAAQFGINQGQAGLYGDFYGQGGQLSGQAFSDAMNALMAQYGYTAQGQNAESRVLWDAANLGIEGAKALKGGGRG